MEGIQSVMAGVWMPMTYAFVALEAEFFGTDFGAYHLVAAFLHAVNAMILFLLLFRMTKAFWKSTAVAILFVVHPLNVEPVAWLVGVRIILCGFFSLLSLYFYALYTTRYLSRYFILSLFSYSASLFAVPMYIPLPFLFLLLDFWPLKRFVSADGNSSWPDISWSKVGRAVWEKLPFFGIMIVLMIILLLSHDLPATPIEQYPFTDRLCNALLSYVCYLRQFLVPLNLAVFYPFPANFLLWKIIGAIFLLALLSVFSVIFLRRFPFLFVGWCWFIGMIFPLSGISQIGTQARADHYMYLPIIGLLILSCWGAAVLAQRLRLPKFFLPVAAIIIISILTGLSWRQAGHWENSVTLFKHTLTVTKDNYEAHNYLAQALAARGDLQAAGDHFRAALAIQPDHRKSHINIAKLYIDTGRNAEAIPHLRQALRKSPRNARLHNNLGALYERTKDFQAAMKHYQQAVTIDPDYVNAYKNLAGLETTLGDFSSAIAHLKRVLSITPGDAATHFQIGMILKHTGNIEEAVTHFRKAISIEPGNKLFRQKLISLTDSEPQQEGTPGAGYPD
ncbi:MAG: tetratricopeptide repeat protein [Desulfobacterales bacterium]